MSLVRRLRKERKRNGTLLKKSRKVRFEPLEPRILLSADFTFNFATLAAGTDHDLTLRLDSAGETLELVDNASPTPSIVATAPEDLENTTGVVITGEDDEDDTLTIDFGFGGAFDTIPISFDGGTQDSSGDSLRVVGSGADMANYTPDPADSGKGTIDIDGGSTITFTGLEPVTVSNMASFTFISPNPDDVLTVDRPGAGQNRISGTSGGVTFESVTFFDIADVIIDAADGILIPSTDVPKAIGPGAGTVTNSDLTVSGVGTLLDVDVTLDITHTSDDNLDVFLISPDGTRVELFTDVGSDGDDFTNTILDDEASTAITAGTVPFTGRFRPEGPLSDFNGEDPTGTWTLEITDDVNGEGGTLNSWSLQLTESYAADSITIGSNLVASGLQNFTINTGSGADTLNVGTTDLSLPVGGGAFSFNAGDDSDTLVGPDAASIWNITGNDAGTLTDTGGIDFSSVENLTGGTDTDDFVFGDGIGVTVAIDGGGGTNTLDYSADTSGVVVDLGAGTATGTGSVSNIRNVTGGFGDDDITGDSDTNTLIGGAGEDTLSGGGGADQLEVTLLDGGNVFGGGNDDTLVVTGTAGDDQVFITDTEIRHGDPATDTISVDDVEILTINAGDGDDTITVESAATAGGMGYDAINVTGEGDTSGSGGPGDTLEIDADGRDTTLGVNSVTVNGVDINYGTTVENVSVLNPNIDLSAAQVQELADGLQALASYGNDLDVFEEFAQIVPFFGVLDADGDVNQVTFGDLFDVGAILDDLSTAFAAATIVNANDVISFLDGWPATPLLVDSELDPQSDLLGDIDAMGLDNAAVELNIKPGGPDLTFDFEFVTERNVTVAMENIQELVEFDLVFDPAATFAVNAGLVMDLSIGLDDFDVTDTFFLESNEFRARGNSDGVLTTDTPLDFLNGGGGVGTLVGNDLRITLSDGSTDVDVDLSDADTVQDVLEAIADSHPNLSAEINADGTGIDIMDTSGGASNVEVTAPNGSDAAADLGIPATGDTSGVQGSSIIATITSPVRAGFLEANVTDGRVNMQFGIDVAFDEQGNDPPRIVAADLNAGPADSDVIDISGIVHADFPVSAIAGDFNTPDSDVPDPGNITFGDASVDFFDNPTGLTISDEWALFTNLNASNALGHLIQLGSALAGFSDSDLYTGDIPFVEGAVLRDLINFGSAYAPMLVGLLDVSDLTNLGFMPGDSNAPHQAFLDADGAPNNIFVGDELDILLVLDGETRAIHIEVDNPGGLSVGDPIGIDDLVADINLAMTEAEIDTATTLVAENNGGNVRLRSPGATVSSIAVDLRGTPNFESAQQLAANLLAANAVAHSKLNYSRSNKELTYDIGLTDSSKPFERLSLEIDDADALHDISGAPTVSTFNSANVPVNIPASGTSGRISSNLLVSGLAPELLDVDVNLNISHTWDDDLDVFLISPAGTRVELFTDVGGSANNFTDTTLDGEATIAITDGSAPFTGTFRPEGDLSTFTGEDPNGVWVLEITDDAGGDTGTLNSWSLDITEPAALDVDTARADLTLTVGFDLEADVPATLGVADSLFADADGDGIPDAIQAPTPPDGILTGDATFTLEVNGTPVDVSLLQADTTDNATREGPNTVLAGEFPMTAERGRLAQDAVFVLEVTERSGTTLAKTVTVAAEATLGLDLTQIGLDHATQVGTTLVGSVDTDTEVVGDLNLPADGQLETDLKFKLTFDTGDGSGLQVVEVNLAVADTIDNGLDSNSTGPEDLAEDLNSAFKNVTVISGSVGTDISSNVVAVKNNDTLKYIVINADVGNTASLKFDRLLDGEGSQSDGDQQFANLDLDDLAADVQNAVSAAFTGTAFDGDLTVVRDTNTDQMLIQGNGNSNISGDITSMFVTAVDGSNAAEDLGLGVYNPLASLGLPPTLTALQAPDGSFQLTKDATFDLIVDGAAANPITVTVLSDDTDGTSGGGANASLNDLVADIQTALNAALTAHPDFASGDIDVIAGSATEEFGEASLVVDRIQFRVQKTVTDSSGNTVFAFRSIQLAADPGDAAVVELGLGADQDVDPAIVSQSAGLLLDPVEALVEDLQAALDAGLTAAGFNAADVIADHLGARLILRGGANSGVGSLRLTEANPVTTGELGFEIGQFDRAVASRTFIEGAELGATLAISEDTGGVDIDQAAFGFLGFTADDGTASITANINVDLADVDAASDRIQLPDLLAAIGRGDLAAIVDGAASSITSNAQVVLDNLDTGGLFSFAGSPQITFSRNDWAPDPNLDLDNLLINTGLGGDAVLPAGGQLTDDANFGLTVTTVDAQGNIQPAELAIVVRLVDTDGTRETQLARLGFTAGQTITGAGTLEATHPIDAPAGRLIDDVNFILVHDDGTITRYLVTIGAGDTVMNLGIGDLAADLDAALQNATNLDTSTTGIDLKALLGISAGSNVDQLTLDTTVGGETITIQSALSEFANTSRIDLAADVQAALDEQLVDAGFNAGDLVVSVAADKLKIAAAAGNPGEFTSLSLKALARNPAVTELGLPPAASLPDISVQVSGIPAEMLDFEFLAFDDVLQGLERIATDFLEDTAGQDELGVKLPFIERSVDRFFDYSARFSTAVSDLALETPGTIQAVGDAIQAVMPLIGTPLISYDTAGKDVKIEFVFNATETTTTPLNININRLADLKEYENTNQPGVPGLTPNPNGSGSQEPLSSLVATESQGELDVFVQALPDLDLGLDLTDPADPRAFLDKSSKLDLNFRATGDNMDFTAQSGPMNFLVEGGDVAIDSDGDPSTNDPAVFSVTFAGGAPAQLFFDTFTPGSPLSAQTETGLADQAGTGEPDAVARLPLFDGDSGDPLQDAGAAANSNILEFDVKDLDALLAAEEAGVPPFLDNTVLEITTPVLTTAFGIPPDSGGGLLGLRDTFSAISILSNRESTLDALDYLLLTMEESLDEAVIDVSLALIDGNLPDVVNIFDGLRDDLLTELAIEFATADPALGRDLLTQEVFFDAWGPGGLDLLVSSGGATVDDYVELTLGEGGSGDPNELVFFDMSLHQDFVLADFKPTFDLGDHLRGLDIRLDAPIDVRLAFDWDFGFGVSRNDGYFVDTSATDELDVYTLITLAPPLAGNTDRNGAPAHKGIMQGLKVDVRDHDSSPFNINDFSAKTRFEGQFAVDILGDPDDTDDPGDDDRLTFTELVGTADPNAFFDTELTANTHFDLDVSLGFEEARIAPGLNARLNVDWQYYDQPLENVRSREFLTSFGDSRSAAFAAPVKVADDGIGASERAFTNSEIRVTTETAHGLQTDDIVRITGVQSDDPEDISKPLANGIWVVERVSDTEIDLKGTKYPTEGIIDISPGSNGGVVQKLVQIEDISFVNTDVIQIESTGHTFVDGDQITLYNVKDTNGNDFEGANGVFRVINAAVDAFQLEAMDGFGPNGFTFSVVSGNTTQDYQDDPVGEFFIPRGVFDPTKRLVGAHPADTTAIDALFWKTVLNLDTFKDQQLGQIDAVNGPRVEFIEVQLDLGQFVSEFARPILKVVKDLVSPMDWLVHPQRGLFFQIDPIISFLKGRDYTWLDSFSEFWSGLKQMKPFIKAIAYAYGLADRVDNWDASGSLLLDIQGISLPDIRNQFDLSKFTALPLSSSLPDFLQFTNPKVEYKKEVEKLTNAGKITKNSEQTVKGLQKTSKSAGLTAEGDFEIDFPILTRPDIAKNLLIGGNADLFILDLPKFVFQATLSAEAIIWFPPKVSAYVEGTLGISVDLAFGFDTQGFKDFALSGREEDIARGFFFLDTREFKQGGQFVVGRDDPPELTVFGSVEGGIEVSALIASAGGSLTLGATVDFNLSDPNADGRVRLHEIEAGSINAAGNFDLSCMFDISGDFTISLDFWIKVAGVKVANWDVLDSFGINGTIFSFQIACAHPPVLATDMGTGVLRLNIGEFAEDRIYFNTIDNNEQYFVFTDETLNDEVTSIRVDAILRNSGGGALDRQSQTFEDLAGWELVTGFAGEGADRIEVAAGFAVPVRFFGGAGNDTIVGGSGDDEIHGDGGNDSLTGGAGDDTLIGDAGNDTLFGGDDDDLLLGGLGRDTLEGNAGEDVLNGQWDDDTLKGGAGDDRYIFDRNWGLDFIDEEANDDPDDTVDFTAVPLGLSVRYGGRQGLTDPLDVDFRIDPSPDPYPEFEAKLLVSGDTVTHEDYQIERIIGSRSADDIEIFATGTNDLRLDGVNGSDDYFVYGSQALRADIFISDTGNFWNTDRLFVFGTPEADTVGLTAEQVSFGSPAFAAVIYQPPGADSGLEFLEINLLAGNDSGFVYSTPPNLAVSINGDEGDDIIEFGTGPRLTHQTALADLSNGGGIDNDVGFDDFNITRLDGTVIGVNLDGMNTLGDLIADVNEDYRAVSFTAQPSAGNSVTVSDGMRTEAFTLGTDVAIGADASETMGNLIAAINAADFDRLFATLDTGAGDPTARVHYANGSTGVSGTNIGLTALITDPLRMAVNADRNGLDLVELQVAGTALLAVRPTIKNGTTDEENKAASQLGIKIVNPKEKIISLAGNVNPSDGETVTINDGTDTVIFEFDDDDVFEGGNTRRVRLGANAGETLENLADAIDDPLVVSSMDVTVIDRSGDANPSLTVQSLLEGPGFDVSVGPPPAPITDLNATVNINHTWDSDLDVFLISPDGTRVELFTDVGGSGDGFTSTVLDDEAGTAITSGSAPFTGSFRPEGSLADFDTLNPNGIWTLEVTDDANRDTGALSSWSLKFNNDNSFVFTASPDLQLSDKTTLTSLLGVSGVLQPPSAAKTQIADGPLEINGLRIYDKRPGGFLDEIAGNQVNGPIRVDGGLDDQHDTLILDDTGDTRNHDQPLVRDADGNHPQASEGQMNDSQIRGLGMWQGIDYSDLEILEARLGQGDDRFTVANTASQSATAISAGGGSDTVSMTGVDPSGALFVYGEVSINSPFPFLGDAGTDTLTVDSGVFEGVTLYGGAEIDTITGGSGDDLIFGGSGNDIINGGDGADAIWGDSGVDIDLSAKVTGATVFATVDTDGGTDVLTRVTDDGTAGDDTINGEIGADVIFGDHGLINGADFNTGDRIVTVREVKAGSDTGNDTINGGDDDDIIMGGIGGDTIGGDAGTDIILGDNGVVVRDDGSADANDIFTRTPAGGDVDTINGGTEDDIILGGTAGDILSGGAEDDIIIGDQGKITRDANDEVQKIKTTDTVDADGGVDTIQGDGGDDIILGGVLGDQISGNGNDDIILGDNGTLVYDDDSDLSTLDRIASEISTVLGDVDTIYGNAGNDIIMGGTAGDILYGGNSEAANDPIAGDDADVLIGDNGEIVRVDGLAPRRVALIQTTDTTNATGGADTIEGNEDNDVILGGVLSDQIKGNKGHDIILGDNGLLDYDDDSDLSTLDRIASEISTVLGDVDTIYGNAGNDIIMGGTAGDILYGGNSEAANDPIAGDDADVLIGDNGEIVRVDGLAPRQVALIQTTDTTNATGGADTIEGNEDDDVILGGVLSDTVMAGSGNDINLGDNGLLDYDTGDGNLATLDQVLSERDGTASLGGSDTIYGNAGNDIVIGGAKGDTLFGGNGVTNDAITGDDFDIIIGDNAELTTVEGLDPHRIGLIETTDTVTITGGDDRIEGNEDDDVILGGVGSDTIDGNQNDDLIAGDNAVLAARAVGVTSNPRFRALEGTMIYGDDGEALIDRTAQYSNPSGDPKWSNWVLTVDDGLTGLFGDDYIAGGPNDDTIFGQRGDDTIQGDGAITETVSASLDGNNLLVVDPSVEAADDGDDYIEGNDGNDTIFGNLGQDDIVGGSSELFGMTSAAQRSDGSDLIFGGAGTDIARNDPGDDSDQGHARDADVIAGDNANIYRLVGTNGIDSGAFLMFNYDDYDTLRIIPRALELLDYTPGGNPGDIGADDLIHGESGDDTLHGMTGNDVIFGEGQDDDIFGGTGYDRLYGGTGEDGILGDDGRILISRNGQPEPLYGLDTPNEQTAISLPGPFTGAVIHITGRLHKAVNLTPFELGGNDIIFGGLGDDFLHAGAGDDAVSGAEALEAFYNSKPAFDPQVDYEPLLYDPATRKFAAYDADNPRTKIMVNGEDFLINFDAFTDPSDQSGTKIYDGKDRIFGDLGHDWLVGGTQNDRVFGGMGDDLINADDNHENGTAAGLNDLPDAPEFADADFAFGGGGLDVLIANTGADRMFDWGGEFNSYFVPFSPFGQPTIYRSPGNNPHIENFLLDLGAASGADQTLIEPDGELGLVTSADPQWGDQHGPPRDPQPGNIPGVQRDTQGGPEDDSAGGGGSGGGGGGGGVAPVITSLSDNPDPVTQGDNVTLTANGVADADGTVSSVFFYLDSNANSVLDVITDELLATDTDDSDGWSVTISTASFSPGTQRYFAQAEDNDGLLSTEVSTTGDVVGSSTVVTTYDSNDVPQNIPKRGTISSTIDVSDSFTILDVNVQVNINHKRVRDLDVFLIAPGGTTTIELFTDVGGNGNHFEDTILDDEATTAITDGSAPFTGNFRPEGDLSVLDGQDVSGTWTLQITDDQNGQSGTLNSWSIIVAHKNNLMVMEAPPQETIGSNAMLTAAALDPIVDEAISRLADSYLLDESQMALLDSVHFEIVDFDEMILGRAWGTTVLLDLDAAGHGWFIDPTPADDAEFKRVNENGDRVAGKMSAAYGDMDLLTVVMHELGHILGHGHDAVESGDLMKATLDTGARRGVDDYDDIELTVDADRGAGPRVVMKSTDDYSDNESTEATAQNQKRNVWLSDFLRGGMLRYNNPYEPQRNDIIIVIDDDEEED